MQIASRSKEAFLESLVHVTTQRAEIDAQQMMDAFGSVPSETFQLAEFNSIVNFSIVQLALWRAKWLYSSAEAPNVIAREQSTRWEAATDEFINLLAQQVPAVRGPLQEKKDLLIVQYLLQEKFRREGDSKLLRFRAWSLSTLARVMYRIGLRNLGSGLQTRAMFPSGTMGRSGA